MRVRFFWIIFFVLTVVSTAATALHGFLMYRERLEAIDQQVRETATALLDSEINGLRSIEFDRVEEILSDELGESRIGKFFIIRDSEGRKIFESVNVKLVPVREVPRSPQWVTIRDKGKFIRVLNLQLPRIPDRTLQVGILVDQSLLYSTYFSPVYLAFLVFLLLLGLTVAWGLTSTLLKPISRLADFVTGITREYSLVLPPLPKGLAKVAGERNDKDELYQLIQSFSSLLEKVNRNSRLSRVWSYQMAHELKTPLAIAEGEIVKARKQGELNPESAGRILEELMEASETITSFLTWAELEGKSAQKDLYAVSVRPALEEIQRRLAKKFGERLELEMEKENNFYVLAGLQHFEHMMLNLISNALHHSPDSGRVKVFDAGGRSLKVRDQGPGIPPGVMERAGEPFNRGDRAGGQGKGHGLGLAYVHSVCKLYGWKITVETGRDGTEVRIDFPDRSEADGRESGKIP